MIAMISNGYGRAEVALEVPKTPFTMLQRTLERIRQGRGAEGWSVQGSPVLTAAGNRCFVHVYQFAYNSSRKKVCQRSTCGLRSWIAFMRPSIARIETEVLQPQDGDLQHGLKWYFTVGSTAAVLVQLVIPEQVTAPVKRDHRASAQSLQ